MTKQDTIAFLHDMAREFIKLTNSDESKQRVCNLSIRFHDDGSIFLLATVEHSVYIDPRKDN